MTDSPKKEGDRRLRVLLLLPSLHGGGAERVALHIFNHADRRQFDVRMGIMHRSGVYLDQIDASRVDSSRLGAKWLDFDQGNARIYRPLRMATGAALAPLNVAGIIRRAKPDVVMTFRKGMSILAMGALPLSGMRKAKWITREGNNTFAVIDDEVKSAWARRIVRRITRQSFLSADRLLTISHEMAEGLVTDLDIPRAQVSTIHNAVDLDEVQKKSKEPAPIPKGDPFIISVGRFEEQKAPHLLIEAFAQSAARQTHRLVMMGTGSMEAELRAQIAELNLKDRVLMPGWSDNPWAWMARADVFALPSRWEGFGNVVIEAMACGVPVVVSDCSFGPKEIVAHEHSGLVTPTGSSQALQQAIDRILGDPFFANRLRQAGLARAQDFAVSEVVGAYQKLFWEVHRAGEASALSPQPSLYS